MTSSGKMKVRVLTVPDELPSNAATRSTVVFEMISGPLYNSLLEVGSEPSLVKRTVAAVEGEISSFMGVRVSVPEAEKLTVAAVTTANGIKVVRRRKQFRNKASTPVR